MPKKNVSAQRTVARSTGFEKRTIALANGDTNSFGAGGTPSFYINGKFVYSYTAPATTVSILATAAGATGSPAHPAYPSGHAAIAGACVTVLKALFDESRKLRFPLQPTRDGKDWGSFDPNLPAPTVGSELNKLATNVAMGRNFAGIHWRSDAWQGLQLGESVARAWLKAEKAKSLEGQQGWLKSFEFTNFAGQRVTV